MTIKLIKAMQMIAIVAVLLQAGCNATGAEGDGSAPSADGWGMTWPVYGGGIVSLLVLGGYFLRLLKWWTDRKEAHRKHKNELDDCLAEFNSNYNQGLRKCAGLSADEKVTVTKALEIGGDIHAMAKLKLEYRDIHKMLLKFLDHAKALGYK